MPVPYDPNTRNLLIKARNMRTKEHEQEFQQALEEGAQTRGVARLARKTGAEAAADPKNPLVSLRPADIVAPYYGDNFVREVAKASLANERTDELDYDAYSRLFDEIPVIRDRKPLDAHYLPDKGEVHMPNPTAEEIEGRNKVTLAKWAEAPAGSEDRTYVDEYMLNNSYDAEVLKGKPISSTLEHEVSHHFLRPSPDKKADLHAEGLYAGLGDRHLTHPSEMLQAAGRFQREMFKNTGSRITNPAKFAELVKSGKIPEFLSPEGKRILIFAKELATPSNEADQSDREFRDRHRATLLDRLSNLLPSVVDNDTDFLDAVEAGLSKTRQLS